MWQIHHIIPQSTAQNYKPLLNILGVDVNDAANKMRLPSNPEEAFSIGTALHRGGHLSSYYAGIVSSLQAIQGFLQESSFTPASVERGNRAYLYLQNSTRSGLDNGQLSTNANALYQTRQTANSDNQRLYLPIINGVNDILSQSPMAIADPLPALPGTSMAPDLGAIPSYMAMPSEPLIVTTPVAPSFQPIPPYLISGAPNPVEGFDAAPQQGPVISASAAAASAATSSGEMYGPPMSLAGDHDAITPSDGIFAALPAAALAATALGAGTIMAETGAGLYSYWRAATAVGAFGAGAGLSSANAATGAQLDEPVPGPLDSPLVQFPPLPGPSADLAVIQAQNQQIDELGSVGFSTVPSTYNIASTGLDLSGGSDAVPSFVPTISGSNASSSGNVATPLVTDPGAGSNNFGQAAATEGKNILGEIVGAVVNTVFHWIWSLFPVVLDLTGKGINITQETSSNTFFDGAGDGEQHQTAWAGAGNAVLFYDPTGTGSLTRADQVVFTDLDPSASNDMQALEDVFDTNHNGSLDAGDASYGNFYLDVTNANGTHTIESLTQAGITAINLTPNAVNQKLPDGSAIQGETTYTTSSGSTGAAATVSFAADATGYAVASTAGATRRNRACHARARRRVNRDVPRGDPWRFGHKMQPENLVEQPCSRRG